MTRQVQIDADDGVVIKPVGREHLMCEVRMTQRACELAATSGLFRVPRVVDFDLSKQWIKLQYIPDTVPLFYLFRSGEPLTHIFARAGRVVAQIHDLLKLDEEFILPLPPSIDRGGPRAFVHGDLNLINVRYHPATDDLVLFDWASSPLIGVIANWGTVYWDLAHFARSTIVSPPIRLTGKKIRWDLADTFLRTYVEHAQQGALERPFFDYCRYIHRFFKGNERNHLQWYRYWRLAALNLSSFGRYVERKIADDSVFS